MENIKILKKISKNKKIILFIPVVNFTIFFLWLPVYTKCNNIGKKLTLRKFIVSIIAFVVALIMPILFTLMYTIYEIHYIIENPYFVPLLNFILFYVWGLMIGGVFFIDEYLVYKKYYNKKTQNIQD